MKQLWPSIVRRSHTKELSIQKLVQAINIKIEKQFSTLALINNTNEISERAAIALWRSLEQNEMEIGKQMREKLHQSNIQSYNVLIDTLCSQLDDKALQVSFHHDLTH